MNTSAFINPIHSITTTTIYIRYNYSNEIIINKFYDNLDILKIDTQFFFERYTKKSCILFIKSRKRGHVSN